ncbi:hypothetical protein ACQP1V_03480 [Microtetraspora malaysiensis]|uniref:hypothetical protein n=1 Tax=Microtetraspora malaysiensis TaxID=161358 RepID=UPI003D92A6CC
MDATREGRDRIRGREVVVGTCRATAGAGARRANRTPPSSPDILRAARDMLPNPEYSITSIGKLLGASLGTLYTQIPDLKELRAAGVSRQLPVGTR